MAHITLCVTWECAAKILAYSPTWCGDGTLSMFNEFLVLPCQAASIHILGLPHYGLSFFTDFHRFSPIFIDSGMVSRQGCISDGVMHRRAIYTFIPCGDIDSLDVRLVDPPDRALTHIFSYKGPSGLFWPTVVRLCSKSCYSA